MKKYLKEFLNKDDGIETIEFVALIAVAAILIAVIVSVGSKMKGTADLAATEINNSMDKVDGLLQGKKQGG